ncbi:IS1595 family transposase [Parashewanella curva]|uniref:IS1595 family transposase n=2 Tax=Parashewanella curva TaxID=2338552 RepID=A0A3L8PSV1_9GAMM|nr:IS1595 family transposase [Parashewanella curva]RLV57663.1 IS1595 family transposase [Parashewanella curva]
MPKNKIQFQAGYSLIQHFEDYGTEDNCEKALFDWKWPSGFKCPHCGHDKHCKLKQRKIYQCNKCHHQTSLISNTIFASSKLPLTKWFLAIYVITQSKTGVSALSLKRQIGVSYNTAWSVKQKIMQVMKERDDKKPLGGTIQLDDAYIGGEHRGGKPGRGSENKEPIVAAVSVNEEEHPIAMRFSVVKTFSLAELKKWAKQHLSAGSTVVSDGLHCFKAVKEAGCEHKSIVTGGGASSVEKEEFTWVNTMLGNVKNAITSSYHSVDKKYLPRYLAEFCYRFNRRFKLEDLLPRFIYIAVRTPPLPKKLLKVAGLHG